MSIATVFLIAIGLAMDAFAVSVAKGIGMTHVTGKDGLRFGIFFGSFQFVMPLLGWLLGITIADYIRSFDHWVAFGLLLFIGGKMVVESFRQEDTPQDVLLTWKGMTVLAVATSIDALAVGVSFAAMKQPILIPSAIIGVVAFVLSAVGVFLGKKVGDRLKTGSELFGGLILMAIGIKILIEHLFFS